MADPVPPPKTYGTGILGSLAMYWSHYGGVRAVGVAHEFDLGAVLLQGHEKLLTLADGHTVVRLAVQDKDGWGLAVPGQIRERGAKAVFLGVLVRTGAHLRRPEHMADIGSAVERDQIDHGRADHRGREAVGMPNDPARHESAVGIAINAEAVFVDPGLLDRFVDHRHEVEVVLATPVVGDLLRERAAV